MKDQGFDIDPEQAFEAARLSKADLASDMVGEFPELQGVMGGYYARLAGQPDAVADAIRDHYKPQGPGDTVPTAPVTVAVAMAEKLDTLVGFFAIDEKPTGSKDPYALRRAALGMIRLVLENGGRFSIQSLAAASHRVFLDGFKEAGALFFKTTTGSFRDDSPQTRAMKEEAEDGLLWVNIARLGKKLDFETMSAADFIKDQFNEAAHARFAEVQVVEKALRAFFADRLTVLLRDKGQRHDLVAAVFALGDDDLVRIVRRVEALAAFLATDDGANLLAGYKRAAQLLKAEEKKGPLPQGDVATGLQNQPAEEVALANAATAAAAAVDAALEAEDFAAAMTALAALRGPVDAFFTAVMVNSDVEAERENRLKLLVQVRGVMNRVADFGQIAG